MVLTSGGKNQRNSKNGVVYSSESFSVKEVIYLLFHKKKCPRCNTKLISGKQKEYKGVGKASVAQPDCSIEIPFEADLYVVKKIFHCSQCDKNYTTSELAN